MYANSHPITRQIKTLKISSVGCNFAYLAHIWDIMVNSLEIIIMKNMICCVTALKVTWRRLFHATLPIDCVYILLQTQQYQGHCVLDDVLMAAKRFIFCSRSTLKAWQKLCDLWFFSWIYCTCWSPWSQQQNSFSQENLFHFFSINWDTLDICTTWYFFEMGIILLHIRFYIWFCALNFWIKQYLSVDGVVMIMK